MRTVYLEPSPHFDEALRVYMGSRDLWYVTNSSFDAERLLRSAPLWKFILNRHDLRTTTAADLDLWLERDGGFYPKVKLENITDEELVEILLMASPEDKVVY